MEEYVWTRRKTGRRKKYIIYIYHFIYIRFAHPHVAHIKRTNGNGTCQYNIINTINSEVEVDALLYYTIFIQYVFWQEIGFHAPYIQSDDRRVCGRRRSSSGVYILLSVCVCLFLLLLFGMMWNDRKRFRNEIRCNFTNFSFNITITYKHKSIDIIAIV